MVLASLVYSVSQAISIFFFLRQCHWCWPALGALSGAHKRLVSNGVA